MIYDQSAEAGIVKSIRVEELIAKRDRAIKAMTSALQILDSCPDLSAYSVEYHHNRTVSNDPRDLETVRKRLDAEYWTTLVIESGYWTFFDRKSREQWTRDKDNLNMPPLTVENARATFERIHADRPKMLAQGVDELFSRLSIDHKTNSKSRFTQRFILNGMVEWGSSIGFRAKGELDDINRAVHVLRGLPEPDSRHDYLPKHGEIPWGTWIDFGPFLRVKFYQGAGTGHIEFKHDADLDRLNNALQAAIKWRVDGDRNHTQSTWWKARDKRRA